MAIHNPGPPHDPLGAFCVENHAALPGSGHGLLVGLTFAAKDVFDVAGSRTGFGNPAWLESHPPAVATAPAVKTLLDAGADMVGKTLTDEITYSLSGQNFHYGTPLNSSAPGRIPGGSSSGSASAVAGGIGGLCPRHRLRRVGASPGQLLRHPRHPSQPRTSLAGRCRALHVELRCGRLVRQGCRCVCQSR